MTGVKAGNAVLDGEVIGKGWRMALEIKSGHDDPIRGIGHSRKTYGNEGESAELARPLLIAV
jgi:hypothetical protein